MEDRALSALRESAAFLKSHGIPDPVKEAEIIVQAGSGVDRVSLYRDDPVLDDAQKGRIGSMLARRAMREPMAYILGRAEFAGLVLRVGPGVLIPRPETEVLVEEVLRLSPEGGGGIRVLDLCTGCGCVALAVAKALSGASVLATDLSPEALVYARQSAHENHIENVEFMEGDLFLPVAGEKFDIITCNPPYIRSRDIGALQPEIRDWEPRDALDGGEDGLDYYRSVLGTAGGYLVDAGRLVIELGAGQAAAAKEIAAKAGLSFVRISKDLCGIERVMVLEIAGA